jgi:ribosomal protein S18 acetylase RimI-like enzyme
MNVIVMRRADRADLPGLIRLLADDALGRERERLADPLPRSYFDAFDAIERDPNQELIAATLDGRIVGTLQLTFTPHLTHAGSWRCTIEGVRVAATQRSAGVGQQMLQWAIARARERQCRLVQLTSDKSRADAIRFYQRLGFRATHEGMKLSLD